MKARSAKEKGSRLERKIAAAYRSSGLFPNAKRQLLSGGGYLKGDIFKGELDEYVDEVKNQEKVKIWEFWEQTVSQCGAYDKPVLHISGNYRPILTVIRFEDYIDMRKEIKDLRKLLDKA